MRFRFFFVIIAVTVPSVSICAQDLVISGSDVWVSQGAEGGYHLYIRKKSDIGSVLLVETTKDPELREPNYAYRTDVKNNINGDELRIIDGEILSQKSGWALIDSTPEFIAEIGHEVFHIYIPYVMHYGYTTTRHGDIYVGNGTYFNIRAFNLPYGDYRGRFQDNPFVLDISQEPLPDDTGTRYMKETEDFFEFITRESGGILLRSNGPSDIAQNIAAIIAEDSGGDMDIVFCIDTTSSMRDYLSAMKMKLTAYAREAAAIFRSLRIGIVIFRDYREAYVTKSIPFTTDLNIVQKTLAELQAAGGGDIPEAVHEALFEAAGSFQWGSGERRIILIGDAPPHPVPRGNITEKSVFDIVRKHNIRVNAIILPH